MLRGLAQVMFIDDPDRAIDLRWRHQRDALLAQGADHATVSALAVAVGTDRVQPGRHGQALFATHGHLALVAELPEPPVRDTARLDALPDAAPLAVQHAPDIPYLAVALTCGGERAPDDGTGDHVPGDYVLVVSEAGRWPTGRVRPEHRLSHRIPADGWRRAAPEVARDLGDLAQRHRAESIVVCRAREDAWASGVLVNRWPDSLRNRVAVVEDDCVTGPEAAAVPTLLEAHTARVLEGHLSAADQQQLDTFLAQRARRPGQSEGVAAAVGALQQGQSRALLLDRRARLSERLWLGREPPQIALSAADLETFGATAVEEEPALTALLYAAVRTGAELIVLPPDRIDVTDGLGVLLRYPAVPGGDPQ